MTARGATCQDRHLRLSFGVTSQHRACQTHQTHNLQQRGRFLCKCSPSRAINDVKLLVTSTCQTSIHNMQHAQTETALGLTPGPAALLTAARSPGTDQRLGSETQ